MAHQPGRPGDLCECFDNAGDNVDCRVHPPLTDGAGAPPVTAGTPASATRTGEVHAGPVTPLVRQPRTFELYRHADPSGISGTGVVAEGAVWSDGTVSLRWKGHAPSFSNWDNLGVLLAVHGHQGATEVRWLDGGE